MVRSRHHSVREPDQQQHLSYTVFNVVSLSECVFYGVSASQLGMCVSECSVHESCIVHTPCGVSSQSIVTSKMVVMHYAHVCLCHCCVRDVNSRNVLMATTTSNVLMCAAVHSYRLTPTGIQDVSCSPSFVTVTIAHHPCVTTGMEGRSTPGCRCVRCLLVGQVVCL